MKRIISLTFIIFTLFILVSCSNKEEADEFIQYYNEEWISINDMKDQGMEGIPIKMNDLEENNKNEEVIVLIENELLPLMDDVLESLNSVELENQKIKKLNDLQIEAEEYAKDSLKNMITYYEGGNVSEDDIDQYNEELQEKYQDVLDYRDELMEKYNLEQTENEDEDSNFYKLKREEE